VKHTTFPHSNIIAQSTATEGENFVLQTRLHASILLLTPASKLWYLCRALDLSGRGYVVLSPQNLELLQEKKSTIYRWLKDGKDLGLFRCYSWAGNTLKISLGSLWRACKKARIKNWGTVANNIPLEEILKNNGRRTVATAMTIQDWQERSRYAAKNQLNPLERKCFEIPATADVLTPQTSPKLTSGGTTGVLHVGEKRIFVGRSFIPFGVSQKRISNELNSQPASCGVSVRTVQRHVERLEVKHRQLMQARREYREIAHRIKQGATSWQCKSDADISFTWGNQPDEIVLHERNGKSSARREGGHTIKLDQLCNYSNTHWRYRCNLYLLSYELTSMRTTRYQWKKRGLNVKIAPVENCPSEISPQTPEMLESPKLHAEGRGLGGQNKSVKNENPRK
nr:hypothetical protein (replication origin region) - Fremyella diplosiphon pFdA plasmid [Plasmid pFdA]